MNTHAGSIQKKGRRYYLVLTIYGKQRWVALHTGSLTLARTRAAELAPRDPSDATGWLRQLVQLGERARAELVRRQTASDLTWDNLWPRFLAAAQPPIPTASRPGYRRWLHLLERESRATYPSTLSPSDAARAATRLKATRLSADRMTVFFRRVWRTLLLGDEVWRGICPTAESAKRHEFYRRLTMDEVRRVVSQLQAAATPQGRALADMVTIGFYTGLRLSDVAELERAEVSPDGCFLHIQPNKLRHSKPRRLAIPLIHAARACVQRRLSSIPYIIGGGERDFLFPEMVGRRPSRMLCAAFRACGIRRQENGRASFHSLRATFISMMDEAGVPPYITDAITGHAGGGMHARYTQPSPASLLRAVMRALPPL